VVIGPNAGEDHGKDAVGMEGIVEVVIVVDGVGPALGTSKVALEAAGMAQVGTVLASLVLEGSHIAGEVVLAVVVVGHLLTLQATVRTMAMAVVVVVDMVMGIVGAIATTAKRMVVEGDGVVVEAVLTEVVPEEVPIHGSPHCRMRHKFNTIPFVVDVM